MSKITNTVTIEDEYLKIIVEKTGDASYRGEVLLDIEDFSKVGKIRITNSGYAYQANGESVAHIVIGHVSNLDTVVDHINHNRLDNRKSNLRTVSQRENQSNCSASRNNTGVVGISLRNNGNYEYYRAVVSDLGNIVKDSSNRKGVSKRSSKQFSVKKYGKERAFELACKWLHEKRREFGYLKY